MRDENSETLFQMTRFLGSGTPFKQMGTMITTSHNGKPVKWHNYRITYITSTPFWLLQPKFVQD